MFGDCDRFLKCMIVTFDKSEKEADCEMTMNVRQNCTSIALFYLWVHWSM